MPSPAGPLTAPPIVLLTLEHAGRTWRHSSRPCDVLDGAVSLHYRGGLAPLDCYQEAPLSGVADIPAQAVEVIADGDLYALAAQAHLLGEVRAEVALWREGDPWSSRLPILSGRAEVESGGYLGRPLRLRVVADDPAARHGIWPPPEQQVTDDTWGLIGISRREQEDKAAYPQVVGCAGTIWSGGTRASVAALPVIPVLCPASRLVYETPWGPTSQWVAAPGVGTPLPYGIVSAGWLYPGSGASMGLIRGTRVATTTTIPTWVANLPLRYALDNLGQIVTLVDGLVQWALGVLIEDQSYYAAIAPPCSGIARPDWRGGLEGAGSVIRWALLQAGVIVDWRRTVPALASLDRYEVGGYWDQSCDPWFWAVDNLLPLLPCSWVAGPHGLYPVVWRLDATAATADCRLTDGLDCVIDGEPKEEGGDDILSRASLDYGHSLIQGAYRRRATWHGQETRDTLSEASSLHLRRAQQRWGSRRGADALALEDLQTSEMVYLDSTAHRSLAARTRIQCQSRTAIRIVSDGLHHRSHVAHLEPGMVVALTSTRYSLSSRVAHVRRAGWLGGVCYADLVMLAKP